jgi:outer membrane protein OmpA-like peptidoglycan-associated protein
MIMQGIASVTKTDLNVSTLLRISVCVVLALSVAVSSARAQDLLPDDNGLTSYHTSPRYRESESHPLRIISYVVHPIGWVLREAIFRPISYLTSSTEVTRSVFGYREPYDFRSPECFSADDSIPDCRALSPYNYEGSEGNLSASVAPGSDSAEDATGSLGTPSGAEVFFPNVNFDFNARKLNALGKGRVKQVYELLQKEPSLKVILQGHADNVGSESYNLKLGMDRSEAVREELIALGVAAERLSTLSFGETQPLFNDDADWARALNRRVEVTPSDSAAAVSAEDKKVVEVLE